MMMIIFDMMGVKVVHTFMICFKLSKGRIRRSFARGWPIFNGIEIEGSACFSDIEQNIT